MDGRDFDTPAIFAAAHAARMGGAESGGGGGDAGARFTASFAPTGDLSAGSAQRRELHVLPSARIVLLDGVGLSDEHADELVDYLRDNSRTELLHPGGTS